jgi:hypothetical protein
LVLKRALLFLAVLLLAVPALAQPQPTLPQSDLVILTDKAIQGGTRR